MRHLPAKSLGVTCLSAALFPITAGVHYHAVFQASGTRVEAAFDRPQIATNALIRVERIYPSANVLPSNALRFYIYFSSPMSRGEAWPDIHLIDAVCSRHCRIHVRRRFLRVP